MIILPDLTPSLLDSIPSLSDIISPPLILIPLFLYRDKDKIYESLIIPKRPIIIKNPNIIEKNKEILRL